jgi:ribosomal protein S3
LQITVHSAKRGFLTAKDDERVHAFREELKADIAKRHGKLEFVEILSPRSADGRRSGRLGC